MRFNLIRGVIAGIFLLSISIMGLSGLFEKLSYDGKLLSGIISLFSFLLLWGLSFENTK
jgi:hypothetical protein